MFAYQGDVHEVVRMLDLVDEFDPLRQIGLAFVRQLQLVERHYVQFLVQHHQWHFVNGRHVDRFDYRTHVHVTEQCYFAAHFVGQVLFGTQDQNVRLQSVFEQLFHRMLGRLGFQFAGSRHVRNQRQVDDQRVAVAQLITELTHRFDVRQRFDIADRTADFGDNHVIHLLGAEQFDTAFDLVGNMRDHLYGFAEKLSAAFLVDNALVDAPGGDVVGFGSRNIRKAFVVAEVEVGFGAVFGYVALAVFVRIQRAGIDIDVRVEFLDRYPVSARLQQARQRC